MDCTTLDHQCQWLWMVWSSLLVWGSRVGTRCMLCVCVCMCSKIYFWVDVGIPLALDDWHNSSSCGATSVHSMTIKFFLWGFVSARELRHLWNILADFFFQNEKMSCPGTSCCDWNFYPCLCMVRFSVAYVACVCADGHRFSCCVREIRDSSSVQAYGLIKLSNLNYKEIYS